jgi:hypothetical protein
LAGVGLRRSCLLSAVGARRERTALADWGLKQPTEVLSLFVHGV